MKNVLIALLLTYFASLTSNAQSNAAKKEKVRRAHQSFIDGILAEDYKLVDKLLADDVTLGFPHGGFEPDWQITGPLSLNLKAERFGRKGGRTYTIVVECEDRDGNIALASVDVVVPHDRR